MGILSRGSRARATVRRLAAPVLEPVDRRFSTVNTYVVQTGQADAERDRKLAKRLAGLEGAVGSFAEASAESSFYVGTELRRIAAAVEESTEQAFERRIARAVGMSLDQLDAPLGSLVNYAVSHRGFAAQAELWFNPPLTVELSAGAARLAGANERIVEIPFAMKALGRVSPGARILDVGSAESTLALSLASLGFAVTAVDPRGLPYSHPNLTTFSGRLDELVGEPASFAAVLLVSTIEHVGLSAYGIRAHGDTTPGLGADREQLREIAGMLKPDGVVVLTTPYGERHVDEFERTYDDESLDWLMEGWNVLERQLVTQRSMLVWEPVQSSADLGDKSVAMLVATPARADGPT